MKINVESGPPEIWMRIRFLEISGSPSLEFVYQKSEIPAFNPSLSVQNNEFVWAGREF